MRLVVLAVLAAVLPLASSPVSAAPAHAADRTQNLLRELQRRRRSAGI